jgi:hypothetical protein
MNGFATRGKQPTADEYLKASYCELLDRLNKNPGNLDTELPFIHSVIAVRTAEDQRKTNEDLVRQTQRLVCATWAVCAATILVCAVTILAIVISMACK